MTETGQIGKGNDKDTKLILILLTVYYPDLVYSNTKVYLDWSNKKSWDTIYFIRLPSECLFKFTILDKSFAATMKIVSHQSFAFPIQRRRNFILKVIFYSEFGLERKFACKT